MDFTGIEKQYFAVNKETNKEEAFDSEVLRDVSVKSKSHINPTDKNSKSRYPEIIKNMALIYNERGETDKALDAMREARAPKSRRFKFDTYRSQCPLCNGEY